MRKFTLLIALLACSIGFSQSAISDLGRDNNPTYPQQRAINQNVPSDGTAATLDATAVSGSTSIKAAQQTERAQPSTEVQAILDRISEVGTVPTPDNLINLTAAERALLNDYYGTNATRQAPGDVFVNNLRASCGEEFGTFPVGGPYTIAPITVITDGLFAGDLDDTGTLYGLNFDTLNLDIIDTSTGVQTPVGPLTNLTGTPSGLAWNESDSTMYASSIDAGTTIIYTIDLTTGTCTIVGNTGNPAGIWLAIDNAGNAFMADLDDNLYSVDLGSGAGTLVGPLGLAINFAQDADFDPDTGTLYMAAYIGGGVNFFASVDTTTGTATPLGTINADCCEAGIIAIEGTPGGGGGVCPAPILEVNQDITNTCMANIAQTDLAQSYMAVEPISAGAGVEFQSVSSGLDVNLSLWDALPNAGGTMLASGTSQTDGVNLFTDVFWDPVVNVTPGNTYYIVIDGDVSLPCVSGNTADPYPGGNVFANPGFTPFPNFDYTFRTYSCAGGGGGCTPGILGTLFAGGNGGSLGGAVYFDITVGPSDIDITDIDVNTAEAGGFTLDVYTLVGTYVGNQDNPGAWGAIAESGAGTAAGAGNPSTATLNAPLTLSAGTSYGIALVLDASHGHDYTNGDGTNQNYSNADITLDLGSASNVPFTAPIFDPRVFNGNIIYCVDGGGGGGPCMEENPNDFTFENGLNCSSATAFQTANDLTVAANEDFTLNQITASIFANGGIALVDVIYYDDAGGLPGAVVGSEAGIVPTSQVVIGSNFGLDVNEIVVDVTPFVFNGQAGIPTTYWVELSVTDGGGTGTVFWVVTSSSAIGNPTALFNAGWGIFDPLLDGVYIWDGDCAPILDNDTCADAFPVACDDVVVSETITNTDTGGNPAPDEWYSFTGTGTAQVVTVSLCDGGTDYDSFLRVFDACGGTQIASNDDFCGLQSQLSFASDGTSTYYIMVEGFASNSGNFSMEITCVDAPPNDDCTGAISMSCGETVVGETNTATFDATAPVCVTGITAPGVWYEFTDTTGLVTNYTLSMCDGGTDYDSKITVYSGDCGALACVVDNDDTCGLQSEVQWQGDGLTTYYILVHGFASNTGNFSMALTCAPVPPPNDMIVNSIDVDEIGFPYTDPAVAMPAATTENGNPTGCNIDGANGVWYNFVPDGDGFATAEIITPGGASAVTFYTAPNENSMETDLTLVDFNGNQCVPGTSAIIPTTAGQAYYVFVLNNGAITDIVIDGNNLGTSDNTIQGFTYYPNPTDGVLNLNAVDNIDNVAIYNLLGQQVLNQNVEATSAELNVSNLAVGAYIMKVSVNGEIGTYKVIKR